MRLIIGLGNPGKRYGHNRHNIGFMAAEEICRHFSFPAAKEKFHGLFTVGEVDGQKTGVLRPLTFMNDSGRAVRAAMDFYKLTPADVLVIHDELDLAPLKLRVKTGGGDAGHNGLKSITRALGTPDYRRLRVGIGHPGHKELVHGYVLSDFSKAEAPLFAELCVRLAEEMPAILAGEETNALSRLGMAMKETA